MRNSCVILASSLSIAVLLLSPGALGAKIIGGNEVSPHSRPYMVLLMGQNGNMCGGALIADNWVLTAAHCNLNKKSKVILGAHSRSKKEPEQQIMPVKKEFPYPCYDKDTREGDLKLVQLGGKAIINKNVGTLNLPRSGQDVKPGTKCHVAGWGLVNNRSPPPDKLMEVNVTVIDRRICNDPKHYNYNPVIGLNMICAGSPKGGKDSCKGDSGSPLICEGTFRGVTSFGIAGKCGVPQGPGIYTLLSKKHRNWIIKTMNGEV